jgi:acyl carrier protein
MSSPDTLASFPSSVKDAHQRWLSTRDIGALDAVVLAVVAYHRPNRSQTVDADTLPDSCQLIADLGYDSLALAEVVFFIEDLYSISISNEELLGLRTVADLRGYVRTKITALPVA